MPRLPVFPLTAAAALGLAGAAPAVGQPILPPYKDASLPVERRVEDLLARMTLEEKVGQLNMPCVYEPGLGRGLEDKREGVFDFTRGRREPGVGPGGGFFTLPNTILPEGPRFQAEFLNRLQRTATEETRLGIPLLLTEEGTHGLMCSGGTIFPEGPALGSTWNLGLIEAVYEAAAREARSIGIHQLYTLVAEPILDPRLGRNQEAYSEDPFLTATLIGTIVRAVQGPSVNASDRVVAGLAHFPGQSQPYGGLERGAMPISERTLRETFLPAWEAGIQREGALGVMATYPAIDGIPAHASAPLLTDLLRDQLGFEGLVLSEGGGLSTLLYEGLAGSMREAGRLALEAGVDVGISYESGYMGDLVEAVRAGEVPEALVDRAVRRILTLKFRLGLFENVFVDPDAAERTVHRADHIHLALEAARQGIVLLKNEDELLPLDRSRIRRIAVLGPNADDPKNQLGDYTARVVLQDVVTVLDGIRASVGAGAEVTYVKGCDVIGEARNEIEAARQAAAEADVAILVLGENEWQARDAQGRQVGTSGEGFDVASLDLTGLQEDLARAVIETGTPTIVVLINGRALSTRYIAERAGALVEAWIPGEQGGTAVAEILFGDVNPSGKLTVTIPRHVGQLPMVYNHPKSRRYWVEHGWGTAYADMPATPLFPFGFGLSYTTFAYEDLVLSAEAIGQADSLVVEFTIRNTGTRAGREVAQLYLEDVLASVATPVKQLRGFAPVTLEPGHAQRVRMVLSPQHLSLWDRDLRRVVEPGEFRIQTGGSSEDRRLEAAFWVREGR